MGFLEDIQGNILKRANIMSQFGRDVIDRVKVAIPAIVTGIRKGVTVGRQVVGVGAKVLRNIRRIPALSRQLDRLPIKPEEVITGATGLLNTIEDGLKLGEEVVKEFQSGRLDTVPKLLGRTREEAERLVMG